jgi:hypothetical protein
MPLRLPPFVVAAFVSVAVALAVAAIVSVAVALGEGKLA